jgi:hypothetical protein
VRFGCKRAFQAYVGPPHPQRFPHSVASNRHFDTTVTLHIISSNLDYGSAAV